MRGSLASLALLAAVACAAPSEKRDPRRPSIHLTKRSSLSKDGVVDPQALQSHVANLKSKYANSLAMFEKNTGTAHPSAHADTTMHNKRQTGKTPLTDANSELWYGPITVGGQEFNVDFDTGSSDLFLPGPNCDSTCSGHTTYSTKGATDAGAQFSLAFGDGSTVQGEVFTDTVSVGGLTAKPQALGAATQYSTGFQSDQFPADGLMGMAWPQIAQISATKPFFNTLIENKAVASGEFGFKLSVDGAELFLGGVDTSAASGSLTTVPLTQEGFWQVSMDSANVDGSPAVKSIDAIIDTGTTLIVGTPNTVSQFYQAIPGSQDGSSTVGQGFFTFPCNSNPQVSLSFGGKSFDISSTFNLGQVQQGSSDCVGGIVGQDIGLDAWIAGDVFLANVYAEFSFDESTVGFAAQA